MSFDTIELDKIICGRGPHIYAFTTETVPNYLKVGDTYRPVERRLDEWRRCFPDLDKKFEGSARVEGEGEYFRDYSVHRFLEQKRGRARLTKEDFDRIKKKEGAYYSPEFFKDGTAEDVADAIGDINENYKALKSGSESASNAYVYYSHKGVPHAEGDFVEASCDFEPRENQREAIENFKKAVASGRKNLLMYAVMRFGKSFTSMCCAQEMGAKLVVIVSAKADVKDEWRETVLSHKKLSHKSNPKGGYRFWTKEDLDRDDKLIEGLLARGERAVVFLTLQYLQGDDAKKRNGQIFDNKIDLLIVDETHFGARGDKLGTVLYGDGNVAPEESENVEADKDDEAVETEAADEAIKVLNRDVTLHLSGTPYRILMSDNEFKKEDIIAYVQYSDILKTQEDWDRENIADVRDENKKAKAWDNPYYGFPQMIRFAFNLNESSRKMLEKLRKKNVSADLSTLLCPRSIKKASDGSHRKFKHQKEVLDLLKVLDGTELDDELMSFLDYDGFKTGQMCRHIVMVLPYKASCDAMEALLSDNRGKFHNLCDYKIINIAGFECPDEYSTVSGVKNAIRDFEVKNQKTMTLTVNRMLTGSTVEEWDTMFFLRGTKSPQDYDQAIFRLQNKYVRHIEEAVDYGASGATDSESEKKPEKIWMNMKPQTLLVDFDPTRMFIMQERRAQIYNLQKGGAGNDLLVDPIKRELDASPIIAANAGKLTRINAANVMEAVSDYKNDRGIKEEALDVSVDLDILRDPEIFEAIKDEEEIETNGSIRVRPTNDEPKDGNVDIGDEQGGECGDTGSVSGAPTPSAPVDDRPGYVKKIQNYYARILLYSFITESRAVSLKDVIDSLEESDNKRIAKNIGLDERTVSLIYDFYSANNWAILRELDYKIMDLNGLSHSGTRPDEKVSVALQKFGKLDDAIVVTPASVCRDMINMIPDDEIAKIVKEGKKILDPASTAGEFAAAFYDRISMLSGDERYGISPDDVKDRIYSIPKSSVCYELTRKTYKMLGLEIDNIATEFDSFDLLDLHKLGVVSAGERINDKRRYEKARLERIKSLLTLDKPFSKITLEDETGKGDVKVNFDIIVGNPPYQQSTGGSKAQATPLYDKFFAKAKALNSRYIALIIPDRWFTSNGFGVELKQFRNELFEGDHVREMYDYTRASDCFPGVDIPGGICYFLWDKEYAGNCKVTVNVEGDTSTSSRPLMEENCDTFIKYNEAVNILDKVGKFKETTFDTLVSPQRPFGIPTNYGEYMAETKTSGDEVKIIGRNQQESYIPSSAVSAGYDLISSYKVFVSASYGERISSNFYVIGRPFVGYPNTVCSETYVAVGPLESEEIASNIVTYMKTKFFRFLVLCKKATQHVLQNVYSFVPLQDFSRPWTDKQLYEKYNLSDGDILFIEKMIRPLN